MHQLQIFNFENQDVRTQLINDEPWFVGKDVAEVLGYERTADAIRVHVDEEDKGVCEIQTPGGTQWMNVINESGLYGLVFKSKLPTAKKFKRWVTSEVLPTIRKTGGYQVPQDPMSALKLMFEATEQTKEEVQEVKERVGELEENVSLSPGEYGYIGKLISRKVFQIGRDRSYNMNKSQKAELFKALNSEITSITGVRTRTQLKTKHFKQVVDFIDDWEPSKATAIRMQQLELLEEE